MSSVRITKQIADEAANEMADLAYDEKIDDLQKEIDKKVEALVKKYIPSPVIACVNEYKDYFYCYRNAHVRTEKKGDSGYYYGESIYGDLSFSIPSSSTTIGVSNDEYNDVRKVYDKKKILCREKSDFINKVSATLYQLRTYKKVSEQLPEAVKYLHIPDQETLPSLVYDELNSIIGNIKKQSA